MPARGLLRFRPTPASMLVPPDFPPIDGSDCERLRKMGFVRKEISRSARQPRALPPCEQQLRRGNRLSALTRERGHSHQETISEATWPAAAQFQRQSERL